MGDRVTRGVGGGIRTVVRTSVATLHSNLVTRPTGCAVRVAIEQQILEAGSACLSILDFSGVGIVDFSCADEVIAKLLQKYMKPDRPAEAFFLVRGASEHHRDPIEAVLERHGLLLVAMESGGAALWGPAPDRLRRAWDCLERLGRAYPDEFASVRGLSGPTATSWLKRLVSWRLAVPDGRECVCSLPTLLADGLNRQAEGLSS